MIFELIIIINSVLYFLDTVIIACLPVQISFPFLPIRITFQSLTAVYLVTSSELIFLQSVVYILEKRKEGSNNGAGRVLKNL